MCDGKDQIRPSGILRDGVSAMLHQYLEPSFIAGDQNGTELRMANEDLQKKIKKNWHESMHSTFLTAAQFRPKVQCFYVNRTKCHAHVMRMSCAWDEDVVTIA